MEEHSPDEIASVTREMAALSAAVEAALLNAAWWGRKQAQRRLKVSMASQSNVICEFVGQGPGLVYMYVFWANRTNEG